MTTELPGKWYFIDGNRDVAHESQSGTWDQAATAPVSPPTVSGGAPSGLTVFTPHPFAAISEQMIGWILQPNINVQAYAAIVDVDVQNHQLSVGGKFDQIAQQGVRYRIYAPPGVRRTQQNTGTLDKFVAAQGTRCLYAGYRWESPYAGWQDFGITQWLATEWRQENNNFTGLYYTLHRHYDPWLMRFTSPDPAASPFYNLYSYTGGNPARYYDPDGLSSIGDRFRGEFETLDNWFGGNGWLTGLGRIAGGGADMAPMGLIEDFGNWALGGEKPRILQATTSANANADARMKLMVESGASDYDAVTTTMTLMASDIAGVTSFGEAWHGVDSVSATKLTQQERNARWVEGGFAMASYATMAVAPIAPKLMPSRAAPSTVKGPKYTAVKFNGNRVYAKLPSNGGTGPARWTRTNRPVSALHNHETTFYQLVDKDTGALLKWGVTKNPATRYSQRYLAKHNARIQEIATGSRRDMLRLEREHIRRIPGSLNKERYAGSYWKD